MCAVLVIFTHIQCVCATADLCVKAFLFAHTHTNVCVLLDFNCFSFLHTRHTDSSFNISVSMHSTCHSLGNGTGGNLLTMGGNLPTMGGNLHTKLWPRSLFAGPVALKVFLAI